MIYKRRSTISTNVIDDVRGNRGAMFVRSSNDVGLAMITDCIIGDIP